jgi:ABC-type dipeptide/oligopeptide/nickel transport system permease component
MTRLLVRRIWLGLLALLAISALLFFATTMLPGDVAAALLGQQATPESLLRLRQTLGLDPSQAGDPSSPKSCRVSATRWCLRPWRPSLRCPFPSAWD